MTANGWSAFASLCFVCGWISAMWQMARNELAEWRQGEADLAELLAGKP